MSGISQAATNYHHYKAVVKKSRNHHYTETKQHSTTCDKTNKSYWEVTNRWAHLCMHIYGLSFWEVTCRVRWIRDSDDDKKKEAEILMTLGRASGQQPSKVLMSNYQWVKKWFSWWWLMFPEVCVLSSPISSQEFSLFSGYAFTTGLHTLLQSTHYIKV